MSSIKKRIENIEQAIKPVIKQKYVTIIYPYGSSSEQAIENHLAAHPEDKDARYYVTIANFKDIAI